MLKKSLKKVYWYKCATQPKLHKDIKSVTQKNSRWLLRMSITAMALFFYCTAIAQPPNAVYMKDTRAESRRTLYKNLINNINKDLSLPLTDSTEENWLDAFYSIELLRYRSPWIENRVHEVFKEIENRSVYFQRSFAEMLYDSYPVVFEKEIKQLFDSTADPKLLAICAEYLLRRKEVYAKNIAVKVLPLFNADSANPVLKMLLTRMNLLPVDKTLPPLKDLLHQSFFSKATIVFSFQRKNRNFPGIAIIRDSTGNFVKDDYGNIFSVPQLARSISNLPGYISNGNTPEGIYRMHGFDVSKSNFIGPTPNIQLTMPFETSIKHFMNDSTIADSVWTEDCYRKLLPGNYKNYFPLYETYYASKAGRTEIIAHGTTVDPSYYKGQTYYPLTPTLGCLCTKEIWNEENGTRAQSDQQKLVDALQRAGGAEGYYIVLELNDKQWPVDINEILPFLK